MMPNRPFAESTCPSCGHHRPLTAKQYEFLYPQVWECPMCHGVHPVMLTTRCV